MATPTEPISLYVHWPFCRSLCPYCDFNSHVAETIDHDHWRQALVAELDHFGAMTAGRALHSVFFGGGTPSLMAPATAGAVLDRTAKWWTVEDDVEVTLEANPTSVEAARLGAFRAAGVNRVSLGVQALDDAALAQLGRTHDLAQALRAVETAGRLFERFSFDLIYARPGQSEDDWSLELRRALALAQGHISVYQLTMELGTPFHRLWARGDLVLPDDETTAALYEITQEMLEAAGLPAYEISNHASPGEACRHNLATWRYDDYVGIGPGAHGRLTLDGKSAATRQHRAPGAWLQRVLENGHASRVHEALSASTVGEEMLMMGLRTTAGVDATRYRQKTGQSLESALSCSAIAQLTAAGLLIIDASGLRATAAGRQRLDSILPRLVS